jgi:hypothetical protein
MTLKTIQPDFAAGVAPPASSQRLAIPESVLQFVREHAIGQYLEKAMEITREVFIGAGLAVSMKRDEYGDNYVDLHAIVSDDPVTEAEKYSACVERWCALIPPHVGSKIQLSTSWAQR